jgi:thioesterase domain-containing protein
MTPETDCVVALNDSSPSRALFCAHTVTGRISCYKPLASRLAGRVAVYGIRAPGSQGECSPLSSVEEAASHYARQIAKLGRKAPFSLLGWSSGGLFAWEIRQQFVSCSMVERVILLETELFLNQLEESSQRVDWMERRMWLIFASDILGADNTSLNDKMHSFWTLDERCKLHYLIEKKNDPSSWRHWKDRPAEEVERYYVFFRHLWYAARSAYRPTNHPGPTICVTPLQTREPEAEGATIPTWKYWTRYSDGSFRHFHCPGSHITILQEPNVSVLSEHISELMNGAV